VILTHEDEIAILTWEGYRVWRCSEWFETVDKMGRSFDILHYMLYLGCENDNLVAGPSDLIFASIDDFAAVYHDCVGDTIDQFGIDPPQSARELLELRACASRNYFGRRSA